ncbi:MAG: hypothetical protein JOZ72_01520 [Alphaproteobacteria bacterium]|nr:hypothetical protein [Alphaproteobacteria bacterium]
MDEALCGYDHAPKGGELLVRFGPSLKVDIGFDSKFVAGFGDLPEPDLQGLDALIDTGASESYIDRRLATELNLVLIDKDAVGARSAPRLWRYIWLKFTSLRSTR